MEAYMSVMDHKNGVPQFVLCSTFKVKCITVLFLFMVTEMICLDFNQLSSVDDTILAL